MAKNRFRQKVEEFEAALAAFNDRLEPDRYVLGTVLVGSLDEAVIWKREELHVWIITADGVEKRVRSDGKDERIFRTFCEDGINIHAEIIPRSRFKLMVEGNSRTAFTHSFFAHRKLVYSKDPSIDRWFADANTLATKDQEKELLAVTTYVAWGLRHADRLLNDKKDRPRAKQCLIETAYGVAALEVIQHGDVVEDGVMERALEWEPELFATIYLELLDKAPTAKRLTAAYEAIDGYIEARIDANLKPVLHYLKKQKRIVPLTELADHFAHSQLYPWHLEMACEWLESKGRLEKVATPFKVTTKSRVDVEEPAYFLDS